MAPEVILVARDQSVQDLLDRYQRGEITYGRLVYEFRKRGWSTLSLYEVARSLDNVG